MLPKGQDPTMEQTWRNPEGHEDPSNDPEPVPVPPPPKPKTSKNSEHTENQQSKDETVKTYDFSKGEIVNKSEKTVSSGPKNFEDAKNLLEKHYLQTRDQIEEKKQMAQKQLEEKIESIRVIFGATPSKPRTPDEEWYYKRVSV